MAGAFVQAWDGGAVTATTATVTVSGATANNLLVANVTVNLGADAFTTPSGWTLLKYTDSDSGANDFGGATYYRIASGTSTDNFTPVWTDSGHVSAIVAEYSGLDSSSPLEDSAENASYIATDTTSIGTGSATPSTADGMAIAFRCIKRANSWYSSPSIDSGFTRDKTYYVQYYAGYPAIASKAYTSTAAQSATWSTADAGDDAFAAIAVFKEPGGGGYEIDGDSLITLTPAAAMLFSEHYAITGDSLITLTPAAVMQFGAGYSISGSTTISLTPSADMLFAGSAQIVGDSLITLTPNGVMEYQAPVAIVGYVTITLTANAQMVYKEFSRLATGKTFTGQTQNRTFSGKAQNRTFTGKNTSRTFTGTQR